MKKKFKYMNLEYTEKDYEYIDRLISHIDHNCKSIVDFFQITNFGESVSVKLFDNLETFRSECSKIKNDHTVPLWLCGLSFYKNGKCYIYTLCLQEYKKTQYHYNDSLVELELLIMHEFVHACHQKYTKNRTLPVWMSEGLATTLSHQYDNIKSNFDATLDQIIYGGTDYKNYYLMFSYVLNNYGRNYILNLLKSKDKLQAQTSILYEETQSYYKKIKQY